MHIEDHEFGKHITKNPTILNLSKAADKIKAAVDSRESDQFMVIGRTDSSNSEGQDAVVERLLAYQDAGADGLFVAGHLDSDHHAQLKAAARVPIFTVDFPGLSAAEHDADVVLYFALSHAAAISGMRTALEALASEGSTMGVSDALESVQEFDVFLGIDQARMSARAYGLVE